MNPKTNTSENANMTTKQPNKETLEQLMHRLEAKGEQQAKQLITPSSVSVEQAQKSILNIIKEGEKKFVQNTGRYMTYSEMRQMYG